MPRIELETRIDAPIQRCFDAARDIDLHVHFASKSRERAVAGRIRGLIGQGEWVSFRAQHFGWPFELTARVTQFEMPFLFVDEQTRGPFARLKHTHQFEPLGAKETLMRDTIEFTCPLRILGRVADPFVERHLRGFLIERAQGLKETLERARP